MQIITENYPFSWGIQTLFEAAPVYRLPNDIAFRPTALAECTNVRTRLHDKADSTS